jgi:hypothetical protein
MANNLIFKAGHKAYAKIRDNGLSPVSVKIIAGAAGGPKWLVLGHLDRYLCTQFFNSRQDPLYLIGSSAAAWRFAAASQADPLAAIQRFQEAYISQSYADDPSPRDVSAEAEKIQTHLLGEEGPHEILTHPFFRLNFMTVRCRGLTRFDDRARLFAGLAMAILGNTVHRRLLGWFFERSLFYDPRDMPPFGEMAGLPLVRVPLTVKNLKKGLLASGSIPWIMAGVRHIPDAPAGVYRDGGVSDYHMDIPFLGQEDGIVLFPHYTNRVIPGWFDKKLPWRKPQKSHMQNVLLVAPSLSFVSGLPDGKLPDRDDFYTYKGRDRERMKQWNRAVDMSRRLSEEFADAVESGRIRKEVMPWE